MYRRTGFVLVVVLLALIQPLKAQDTATVTDRQMRQRLDQALTDTRQSIAELNQVLARMQTLRAAVQARIVRDSLAARTASGGTRTPATNTGNSGGPSTTLPSTGGPPAVAAVFEDGFEGGAPLEGRNGYGWVGFRQAAGEGVAMSREVAHSGSSSMRFTYAGNPDPCADGSAEQRFTLGENLPEVWLEYYIYMPAGPDGRGRFVHRRPACPRESDPNGTVSNNKFFALWGSSYDVRAAPGGVKVLAEYRRTGKGGDGDSYLYGMWCNDTRLCSDWGWTGGTWDPGFTDAVRGRWMQVRIHARVADSKQAANGMLQMWFDGALRVNMQNLDLAPEPGGERFFRNGYLMGWANSGFDQQTSVYVDDFRVFRANPGWQ